MIDCNPNPSGLCMCGCGKRTRLARQTRNCRGQIRQKPLRFINGHNFTGELSPHWRGGSSPVSGVYPAVKIEGHHRGGVRGYVQIHILAAEAALGKPLPPRAVVHHVNGDPTDNRNSNLVVCQDQAYHMLIEARTRAFEACGHADWVRCWICDEWSPREDVYTQKPTHSQGHHRECRNRYDREKRSA